MNRIHFFWAKRWTSFQKNNNKKEGIVAKQEQRGRILIICSLILWKQSGERKVWYEKMPREIWKYASSKIRWVTAKGDERACQGWHSSTLVCLQKMCTLHRDIRRTWHSYDIHENYNYHETTKWTEKWWRTSCSNLGGIGPFHDCDHVVNFRWTWKQFSFEKFCWQKPEEHIKIRYCNRRIFSRISQK